MCSLMLHATPNYQQIISFLIVTLAARIEDKPGCFSVLFANLSQWLLKMEQGLLAIPHFLPLNSPDSFIISLAKRKTIQYFTRGKKKQVSKKSEKVTDNCEQQNIFFHPLILSCLNPGSQVENHSFTATTGCFTAKEAGFFIVSNNTGQVKCCYLVLSSFFLFKTSTHGPEWVGRHAPTISLWQKATGFMGSVVLI